VRSTRLVAVLAAAAIAAQGAAGVAEWSHYAPIRIGRFPDRGLVEAALTPEVHDLARQDLADLRVVAQPGGLAPYVLSTAEPETRREEVNGRLYNRGFVPGRQCTATVDFGRRVLKNQIEVETPGTDFRREVLVEGSEDGLNWQRLRDTSLLFRVAEEPGGFYEKKAVSLPDSDHQYLRITVFHGKGDPEYLTISQVRAWRLVVTPAETEAVAVASQKVIEDPKAKTTEITWDLGFRNLPLHQLAVRFRDANFCRQFILYGRNRLEREERRPTEDGGVRQRWVPEPWVHLSSGWIHRFTSGGVQEESAGISLSGAQCRYLRLVILNRDDPPLQLERAEVRRLVTRIAFRPVGQAGYWLYLGHAGAEPPRYDLAQYAARLRAEGVAPAEIGPVALNPGHEIPAEDVPWTERNRVFLFIALAVAIALIGWLVFRQAAYASRSEPDGK